MSDFIYKEHLTKLALTRAEYLYNSLTKYKFFNPTEAKIAILLTLRDHKYSYMNQDLLKKVRTFRGSPLIEKYKGLEKVYDKLVLGSSEIAEVDPERLTIYNKKWSDIYYYCGDTDNKLIKETAKTLKLSVEISSELQIVLEWEYRNYYRNTLDLAVLALWEKNLVKFPEWFNVLNVAKSLGRLPDMLGYNIDRFIPSLFILDYYSNRLPLTENIKAMMTLVKLCRGIYFSCHTEVLLLPKPKLIKLDANNRLHCTNGPAFCINGTEEYFWHGVEVDKETILHPETITVTRILDARNTEISRVLLEIMGNDKFLEQTRTRTIYKDTDGAGQKRELLRIPTPSSIEDITFIRVTCPSTGRKYLIRVPPNTKTCSEAVAWTFGIKTKDYKPIKEG